MSRNFPSAFGGNNNKRRLPMPPKKEEVIAEPVYDKSEMNDINFPSMRTTSDTWGVARPTTKSSMSFASLASEWQALDEMKRQKAVREQKRLEEDAFDRAAFACPASHHFGTSSSRREDMYEEQEEEAPRQQPHEAAEEEWTTVTKRVYKPKTVKPKIQQDTPQTRWEDAHVDDTPTEWS